MAHTEFTKPGQSLQRKQTVYRTFTDQHGRRFSAQCDYLNQQPKEELRPVNDDPRHAFMPPWLPPMRYAKFTEGSLDFRWDYETMAQDLSEMAVDYYQRSLEFAIQNKSPMPELGGPVDKQFMFLEGKPPLSPAIPLGCEQGDPWLLGVPGAPVNTVLEQVLTQGMKSNSKLALELIRKTLVQAADKLGITPVPAKPDTSTVATEKVKTIHDVVPAEMPNYKEFVKECRGRGMSMPDIYTMWDEHKKLVAAEA